MSASDDKTLDWALYYESLGLSIVPVVRGGKAPGVEWKPFQERRATVPELVSWFEGLYRECGLGVVTGAVSGLWAADIDNAYGKDGAETWAALQVANDDVPDTWRAMSGGGGRHWFFRQPGGARIKTGKDVLGHHVDVRGDGGFLVLPPTVHPNGRKYEWAPGYGPDGIDLADTPAWLLELVRDGATAPCGPGTRPWKPSPGPNPAEFDAWGRRTDGREQFLRDTVWRYVVDLYRERGGEPLGAVEAEALRETIWEHYSRRVTSQSGAGLEAEGRGQAELQKKLRYALGHWDNRVAADAGQPPPGRGAGPMPEPGAGPGKVVPEERVAQARAQKARKEPPLRVWSVAEMLSRPPVDYLVEGAIPRMGVGIIVGAPSSLKSFVTLDLALSVSHGLGSWLGFPVLAHGDVLYCVLEGQAGFARRVRGWFQHHGDVRPSSTCGFIEDGFNLLVPSEREKFLETVAIEAEGRDLKLVVIDTTSQAIVGGDENSAKDMSVFVKVCLHVARQHGCTVVALHHPPKNGEGLRGSGALGGNVDWVLECTKVPGVSPPAMAMTSYKARDMGDGLELLVRTREVVVSLDGRTTLVVESAERAGAGKGEDTATMPVPAGVQAGMLRAVDAAWNEGQPMSMAIQTKTTGRHAVRVLATQFRLRHDAVSRVVMGWLDDGIANTEVNNRKTKTKGLRVVNWPAWAGPRGCV